VQIQSIIQAVIQGIVAKLEDNLAVQVHAAKDAHMAATHSESSAETKWDTFGLESSYLAEGQQKRVEETTVALYYFKQQLQKHSLTCVTPTTSVTPATISVTPKARQKIETLCYVTLDCNDQLLYFVLAAQAGGLKIIVDDKTVTVITPGSPIGKAMKDKMVGDEIDITLKGQLQTFEVMQIV
jgi:hypothetical protein